MFLGFEIANQEIRIQIYFLERSRSADIFLPEDR